MFRQQIAAVAAAGAIALPTVITATMTIEDEHVIAYVPASKRLRVVLGPLCE